jgi:hypothetical protein
MWKNPFEVLTERRNWPKPRWLVIFGLPAMVAGLAFAITFFLYLGIVAEPAYFLFAVALPASESAVSRRNGCCHSSWS